MVLFPVKYRRVGTCSSRKTVTMLRPGRRGGMTRQVGDGPWRVAGQNK
jgi:hypothetical protein